MKCKLFLCAVCCVILLQSLSGCQLARKGSEAGTGRDRLVGVYITMQSFHDLTWKDGGGLPPERLYAVRKAESDADENLVTYEFEGLEGFACYYIQIDGVNDYRRSVCDSAISDLDTHIAYTDQGDKITLEGVLYVTPSKEERIYYHNPVYQCADGSVYLTGGSGYQVSYHSDDEGQEYSQTVEETFTVTENGKSVTKSMFVKVAVNRQFRTEQVRVLQMDGDSGILSQMLYEPGTLPEEFRPGSETAYLIVESHKRDAANNPVVTRGLYGKTEERFTTFAETENGIAQGYTTEIQWGDDTANAEG